MNLFWNNKRVLVTGHTGFKGSWLSLWLNKLGANVIGYALEPQTNLNIFEAINLANDVTSIIGDIRDRENIPRVISKYKPEVIFHLAAQPIVRVSYEEPIDTLETNVIGTANLLDAARNSKSVKVFVNITSDKCYKNVEKPQAYTEEDILGGRDPYSCSKSCAELITYSFRESYFKDKGISLATARAGNVIGGGDWSKDRICTDIITALINNMEPILRNPNATRPWQHVLEPLSGYMLLAEKMWEDDTYSQAWNFGPDTEHEITVAELTNKILSTWGEGNLYNVDFGKNPHEAQMLKLDSSKSRSKLGWNPRLDIDQTIQWTVDWYKAFYEKINMKQFTLEQIQKYEDIRRK